MWLVKIVNDNTDDDCFVFEHESVADEFRRRVNDASKAEGGQMIAYMDRLTGCDSADEAFRAWERMCR
jgi:hypothetical protein